MKRFTVTYRTKSTGITAEYVFAQNKAHAFAIARARHGNMLLRVEKG